MTRKNFTIPRLELVRDIFLFCCYTGLSYADIKKLKRNEIRKGDDDKLWIFTSREKNDNSSNIPLLDLPKTLMDKYKDRPECKIQNLITVKPEARPNKWLRTREVRKMLGISAGTLQTFR